MQGDWCSELVGSFNTTHTNPFAQPAENCYHATRTIFPVTTPHFKGSAEDFSHLEYEFSTVEPATCALELRDKT
ncbi:MAG: hypothetical protein ACUVWA_12375 [Candidatus Oleimicrobiaceae bacterium]